MSEKQIINTPSLFKVDDSFQDERFMRVRIAVIHSNENLNKSFISKETIEAAKDTFANIPILANVITKIDENGNEYMDYNSHDMHIEDDAFNEGEERIIYDEKVVGVVPEQNNFELVYDENTGNDYAYVDALIYRDYGNYCADVLESRGGTTSVSAEISFDKKSFDAKNKIEIADKITMWGITLLGADVSPGMKNAHATTFSADERQEQFMKIMQELKESLDNYIETVNNAETKKGENNMADFDENVEVAEAEEVEKTSTEKSAEEVTVTEAEEVTPDEDKAVEEEFDEESKVESEQNFVKMSVDINGSKKDFSVSLADKLNALYTLVNDTYAESDNDWFDVDGYDEDKYVIMHGWFSGKHYRQSYSVKKDVYSLKGDRVEVYATYLTEDEQKQLENMKSNYSSISEKFQKYEEEPDKLAILQSDEYSDIAESEEFKKFCQRESYFEMSVDEVKSKADAMLLEAAKAHKVDFSVKEEKKSIGMKKLPISNKSGKSGRYGGLFKK